MPPTIADLPIFVYGTLMAGECRAPLWPHPPVRREPAVVQGYLYDLGPHPALVDGDDVVAGELWYLDPAHLTETLRVLDDIEGYHGQEDDWYVREAISCRRADGTAQQAYVYRYGHPEQLRHAVRILPDGDGRCRWSAMTRRYG